MLIIRVGETESFDESSDTFVKEGGTSLGLEHSLLSLSKWEAIFEKPFLDKTEKSQEETLTYIRCMCLDDKIPPEVFQELSQEDFDAVNTYLNRKMTATWFSELPGGSKKTSEVITAELIYYWMTAFNIPLECERWNLNRLFTLIRICNIKQGKPKKMSRAEVAQRNRELNAQRKARLGTSG